MNELEKLFATKKTENGDEAYNTTGNNLLDILFMTSYFEKHLDEVKIGEGIKEGLFSMFIRDPRYGLGRRDLGRELMKQANILPEYVVLAGRYDDLWHNPTTLNLSHLANELYKGNELAKKWMPRLTTKDRKIAKALCKEWHLTEKEYRKLIKCESTVEYKLSYAQKKDGTPLNELFKEGNYEHPLVDTINFEQVPSLAMVKYFSAFARREDTKERFQAYLDSVKKGEKKLNISTTNVYDIYKNRDKIDADLFFDKLEKIEINCIPILDTSGSMFDSNDSIGKAMSIAHYLSKCSTYCNGQLIGFSSRPHLMTITEKNNTGSGWYSRSFGNSNKYSRELNSMYTGDCANTDFGKVMKLLEGLNELPQYLVVLSDMEFDFGSCQSKKQLQQLWEEKGYTTKIIWWNFNSRNKTAPELDEMGNIFISGYSPMMLKYLESGFDGDKFLDKLLSEYSKNIDN